MQDTSRSSSRPPLFPISIVRDEIDEQLKITNDHLKIVQQQLDATPATLDNLHNSQKDEQLSVEVKCAAVRAENQKLIDDMAALSERLKQLEELSQKTSNELATSYNPSEITERAIRSEGELSSLRSEARALSHKQNELKILLESLTKTLQRKEAHALDETSTSMLQYQQLASKCEDERARGETLQRQVAQREDCSSILISMQSKAAHLRSIVDDYRTQTDRLHRDLEDLAVHVAEERSQNEAAKKAAEDEVDEAAKRCQMLEAELRQQMTSMHDTMRIQKSKATEEINILNEMLKMGQAECEDLNRDLKALHDQKLALEKENMTLAVHLQHNSFLSDAEDFLRLEYETRSLRGNQRYALPNDDGFIIRTNAKTTASTSSSLGSNIPPDTTAIEEEYLLRLRIRIGVLEKDLQRAATEKDATAAQLEHLSKHQEEEERVRSNNLHLLRTEVRSKSFHEELKVAKLENISLSAMIHERDSLQLATEDDVEMSVASLTATINELKKRIQETTEIALQKEREQNQELERQRNAAASAKRSFEIAAEAEQRDLLKKRKLEKLIEENNRLKDFFKNHDSSASPL